MPNIYLKLLSTAIFACSVTALDAQWKSASKIPSGVTDGCLNFVIGDTAYVSGGLQTTALYKYHAASNKWATAGNLGGNDRKAFGFGFAINGKGYIMGGTGASNTKDDLWMYDPATGQWTQKASFGGGTRNAGFCFVIGNTAYVGGGADASNGIWNDLWKYDAAANQWTKLPDLPMGAIIFPAYFVVNGKAYVTTWEISNGTATFEENTMWEYNPAGNGSWAQKASFPGTARQCATAFSLGSYGFVGYYELFQTCIY